MRLAAATAAQTAAAIAPTGQDRARMMPNPVATPLPPRKCSQTGKQWPMIAATAATGAAGAPSNQCTSSTAATPLAASSSSVAAASPLWPVRRTLVAPILPEPIARMSPRPAARVSSRPNGIEPSR